MDATFLKLYMPKKRKSINCLSGQGSCDRNIRLVLPSMVMPSQVQLVLQIMLNRDLATQKNRPMLEVEDCYNFCKVCEKDTKVMLQFTCISCIK